MRLAPLTWLHPPNILGFGNGELSVRDALTPATARGLPRTRNLRLRRQHKSSADYLPIPLNLLANITQLLHWGLQTTFHGPRKLCMQLSYQTFTNVSGSTTPQVINSAGHDFALGRDCYLISLRDGE